MEKVNILGCDYKIVRDDGSLQKENADGVCQTYDKIIRIAPLKDLLSDEDAVDMKTARSKEVMRHEIVHAFFTESGLSGYNANEQLVDWIARQFPKMARVFEQLSCLD